MIVYIVFPCLNINTRVCIFLFAGPSSVVCIETLRQEGYKGRIVLCCREDTLPYDRPKLSKVYFLILSLVTELPLPEYKSHEQCMCESVCMYGFYLTHACVLLKHGFALFSCEYDVMCIISTLFCSFSNTLSTHMYFLTGFAYDCVRHSP